MILFFVVLISILFGRSIAQPVIEASEAANRLSEGDLTARVKVDYTLRNDEIGVLSRSINSANEKLEQVITSIINGMQNLYYATEQISQGNQDLSKRTTEQASSLEEIASTIEETTAAISQNAENARHANKTSVDSYQFAETGGRLVNEAVSTINGISESSNRIGEIISVINEIAFQTNLLALNAAVEAARAGEQGRGFAVVAGEVRNLAQRSAVASKQIGDLIRESVEKIRFGTEQANRSGESINDIINSIKNVTALISEISAASDEQKSGIDQINAAVTDLDNMTQQNAALVEETASASEEMSSQALELMNTMKKAFKIEADLNSGVMGTVNPQNRDKKSSPSKTAEKSSTANQNLKPAAGKTDKGNVFGDDFDVF